MAAPASPTARAARVPSSRAISARRALLCGVALLVLAPALAFYRASHARVEYILARVRSSAFLSSRDAQRAGDEDTLCSALSHLPECGAATAPTAQVGASSAGPAHASGVADGSLCVEPRPARDGPQTRYVIARGVGGLADSWQGVVTGFLLALLTRSALYIDFGGDVRWNDGYAFQRVDWDALYLPDGVAELPRTRLDAGAVTMRWNEWRVRVGPPDNEATVGFQEDDLVELFRGRRVLELTTNACLAAPLFRNPRYAAALAAAGLEHDTAFGCVVAHMARPRPAAFARFRCELAVLLNASVVTVGMHIRAGANYDLSFLGALPEAQKTAAFYDPWWACAEHVGAQLQAQSPGARVVWYLLSDSVEVRRAAQSRFGDRVLTRTDDGFAPVHTRSSQGMQNVTRQGFLDAVMEQWALSLADAFIISEWSGFGRQAAVLRNGRLGMRPVFQLSARDPKPTDCSLSAALPFATLALQPGFV